MARDTGYYASGDAPTRAELAAEEEPPVCPFCDNEVCTSEAACAEAAKEHWDDLALMHALGK